MSTLQLTLTLDLKVNAEVNAEVSTKVNAKVCARVYARSVGKVNRLGVKVNRLGDWEYKHIPMPSLVFIKSIMQGWGVWGEGLPCLHAPAHPNRLQGWGSLAALPCLTGATETSPEGEGKEDEGGVLVVM